MESTRVMRLGLIVGGGFGGLLGLWLLLTGAPIRTALLWGATVLVAALILAGISVLGIRLQRKDLPRPD